MQMLLNISFRALFLLQEQQNIAEIDKRARISLFPWCKLNIKEQNTRTKLPQHLKQARVPTQLLVYVKLPRNDSCIQDYSAIAQRLHMQYCTQYNTIDIKIKNKKYHYCLIYNSPLIQAALNSTRSLTTSAQSSRSAI